MNGYYEHGQTIVLSGLTTFNLKEINMRKILLAGVLLGAFVLSGCMVGLLSKQESFNGTDSFAIASPRSDILDVIAAVAKEMGMSVSSLDKKQGYISFQRAGSATVGMLTGSMNSARLTIVVKDAGKTLDISTMTTGNFGTGGQDTSTKLIEEFKAQLAKKLDQSVVSK